jgi:1,3-beta-glucanosyltransferase GAS1
MFLSFSHIAVAFATALSLVFQVDASDITRVGRYLYGANGARWYMKGIAYQPQGKSYLHSDFIQQHVKLYPGNEATANANAPFAEPTTFIDPLADGASCQRDAPILQAASINAIRVYSVDSTKNHDTCMEAFNSVGIYVMYVIILSSQRYLPAI